MNMLDNKMFEPEDNGITYESSKIERTVPKIGEQIKYGQRSRLAEIESKIKSGMQLTEDEIAEYMKIMYMNGSMKKWSDGFQLRPPAMNFGGL